jgi:hypothetical protein
MNGVLQVRAAVPADDTEVIVAAVNIAHTKRLRTDAAARDVIAAASGA